LHAARALPAVGYNLCQPFFPGILGKLKERGIVRTDGLQQLLQHLVKDATPVSVLKVFLHLI